MSEQLEVPADFNPQNRRVSLVFVRELAVFDVNDVLPLDLLLIAELQTRLCKQVGFHAKENRTDADLLHVLKQFNLVDEINLLEVSRGQVLVLDEAKRSPEKRPWCMH